MSSTGGPAGAFAASAFSLLNHVPIVIAGSPVFPRTDGVQRVRCAAVMVVLEMAARATRLATGHSAAPATRPGAARLRGAP